ncbi:MAG: hypothetical protein Q9160_007010 [Pyrenula sp. 1 TL-2023]
MSRSPQTPSSYRSSPSSSSEEESPTFGHADIFPTPMHRRIKTRGSPAPTKLFDELKRAQSTPPIRTDDRRASRLETDTLGELPSVTNFQSSWESRQLSKKRSQYYNEAFASREPYNGPRERVQKDSVIIGEIKLNRALRPRTSLLSDLSFHLAQSYQRPDSCVVVTVQESAMIMFGGNDEPAYLLTITALSSEITPIKNKRVTALTQDFLQDTIEIPPSRGIIRFLAVPEESLATCGTTALGEIENLTMSSGPKRTLSRAKFRKPGKDSKTMFPEVSKSFRSRTFITPPASGEDYDEASSGVQQTTGPRLRKRKSIMAFFNR